MKKENLSDLQISAFFRGLALQLHAGIGLGDGVFLLAEEETENLQQAFQALGETLDSGGTLAAALEQSGIFSLHACRMVAAGERTGRLEETLDALADHYEQRHETAGAIGNALAYPLIVFGLMILVVAVLLTKVLPVFDRVYASLGSRLRGIAAWLLYLGQGLDAAAPVLAVALAGLAVCFVLYVKWGSFRQRINGWFLTRFGDRGIAKSFHDADFTRVMAMGLTSGMELEDTLALAGELLEDVPAARMRCGLFAEQLHEGKALAEAMTAAQMLSPAEGRLLTVGLRGGNADAVLWEISRKKTRQAWEMLERKVRRIEPILVLVSSVLVGAILLAVMLPLLDIMSTIG